MAPVPPSRPPPSLLILPPITAPGPSIHNLRTTLQPIFHSVLKPATALDVILPIAHIPEQRSRASTFQDVQCLLGKIYLITEALQEGWEEPVDVAIILVGDKHPTDDVAGVLHSWDTIKALLKEGRWKTTDAPKEIQEALGVTDGSVWEPYGYEKEKLHHLGDDNNTENPAGPDAERTYVQNAAVGGTFDHLHSGHKLLLTMTTYLLNPILTTDSHLIIGITVSEMLQQKQYLSALESFPTRVRQVLLFLHRILLTPLALTTKEESIVEPTETHLDKPFYTEKLGQIEVEIYPLKDAPGPTTRVENINALVVSRETEIGVPPINDERESKLWPPLKGFVVDLVGHKEGLKISSTDLRKKFSEQTSKQ
ncbi:hypothetical protein BJ508DRAFT_62936 [Ascobolus immersus RN42]|uniref:Cytidyltransferase-like domain-containing protein n=1 Tax=Ascobolus immersus RN42 TaxID=1160509 RepID=A0A3N4IPE2_ASCIM|nr:hypothetical protein BJ508DRAFT_62936 [Ascobolus immersus RN42]